MSDARWMVKKAARAAVGLGTFGTGALALGRLAGRSASVRALTYHRVADDAPRDPFCVTRDAFEAQMRLLAEEGRAVSLEDVRAFVAGRKTLPADACLVTIDDGCVSTLTDVLPTLARWGVPAVAFVSPGLIGLDVPELPERYMGWDELRALADSGLVTVGSHAYTHRSLGQMPPEEARIEAHRSRERLEEELSREVLSFAYPFGTRGDFDAVTNRALADAGYRIAFHSMHGAIRPGMDPVGLPRVKVEGGEPLPFFSLLSRGAMDPWWVVDRNLSLLQRVRAEIA